MIESAPGNGDVTLAIAISTERRYNASRMASSLIFLGLRHAAIEASYGGA
jgi:hypothetical protein